MCLVLPGFVGYCGLAGGDRQHAISYFWGCKMSISVKTYSGQLSEKTLQSVLEKAIELSKAKL